MKPPPPIFAYCQPGAPGVDPAVPVPEEAPVPEALEAPAPAAPAPEAPVPAVAADDALPLLQPYALAQNSPIGRSQPTTRRARFIHEELTERAGIAKRRREP